MSSKSLQGAEWQRCGTTSDTSDTLSAKRCMARWLQPDAPSLLNHLELLFQHRPMLSNMGQPNFWRFLSKMVTKLRYPSIIVPFHISVSPFPFDSHGQIWPNRTPLPCANAEATDFGCRFRTLHGSVRSGRIRGIRGIRVVGPVGRVSCLRRFDHAALHVTCCWRYPFGVIKGN